MDVFHFQSQKYKIDQNEVDAEAWVDGMMHFEVVKNPYLNLFNHIGGGGPYGAEWNSDGDLFVRGTFSLPKSALGDFDFRVNGVALKDSIRVIEKGQATLLGIRVPSAFWQAHLKPIQEKNYAYFFQEDDIERIRNEENGGISEMKGLLFELTYGWEGRKMVLRNGVAFGFGE